MERYLEVGFVLLGVETWCQRECKIYLLGETKIYPPAKKGGNNDQPRCMLPSENCVGRKTDDQA